MNGYGNFIGTDKTGLVARGNGATGVEIQVGANGNILGAAEASRGNVIASNGTTPPMGFAGRGVSIFSNETTVQNNLIGVGYDGTTALGNVDIGVFLGPNSTKNKILDGTIENNKKGVDDRGTKNTIQPKRMSRNDGLGIDVGPEGVTTAGMPVLTSATVNNGLLTVQGTLNSTPNTSFAIDIFGNTEPDPSGYGEGEVYLGSILVTTDAFGYATFSGTFSNYSSGLFVTATATDLDEGGTSEFSLNRVIGSSAAVGARIWDDTDGDGIQDEGEAGIEGIIITLVSLTGGTNYAAVTDADGRFLFTDVDPGQYRMVVILPVGYSFTQQNQGGNDEIDSDVDQTGQTDPFTLAPGEFNPFLAAGLLSSIVIDDDPLPGDG